MLVANNLIRSATRSKNDRLSCVAICRENESFLKLMSNLECDFYVIRSPNVSDWKNSIQEKPRNVKVINDLTELMSKPIDFVLCNDRLQEFDLAYQISSVAHVPLLLIDHVSSGLRQKLPLFSSVGENAGLFHRPLDINVATSDQVKTSWSSQMSSISICIPIFLEEECFEYDLSKKKGFLIDNNVPQDAINFIAPVFRHAECNLRYIDGQVAKNPKDYIAYVNTWNNIDAKTLMAMSAGCITISPKNQEIENFITHGENGLLFENPPQLYALVDECLNGKHDDLIENSIATAKELTCSKEEFLKKWNQVLGYISNLFYIRK